MKPPPFGYRAVSSAAEAAEVLAQEGSEAAVLAGGQSLLIDLRYRRIHPRLVLDINPARELAGVSAVADVADWAGGGAGDFGDAGSAGVRIGALVRHRELEEPPPGGGLAAGGPAAPVRQDRGDAFRGDPLQRLLAMAARHVAHPPVRTRGTLAGSVAWAHPAAEWCALTAGLGGTVETLSTRGSRLVPAANWFTGRHRTARRPDELVNAVRLPLLGADAGIGFAEHRRTHASFAMAAAVAAVRVVAGRIAWARIGLANAADVPVRAAAAERLLAGSFVTGGPAAGGPAAGGPAAGGLAAGDEVPAGTGVPDDLLAEAAGEAAAAADPVPEPYCPPEYRRHVLRVLVRRSLRQAVAGAGGGQ